MYNRNYYAQVDDAMMKLWKDFGRRLLHVLDGTILETEWTHLKRREL